MRIARSDIQHRGNTSVLGPLNNIVTVRIKLLAVNMAVRINEDHLLLFSLL
jgi:hypothetical protein